ncbi:sensor histidine kinase [Maritimibacter sp. HL-12]|uniref:sensor histidine kinase n=1 Tax=Maritimibacter sp. HL-12 TaxID=1162418 RepID=UPI000A0F3585|nr:sensor histidine kinase [Maritimibacter sp. HL-12]SMH53274.1 Two-component sensor histidine kinase, contains HisKA and HATPase domains [Maritimibacter sp. HL-12]
MPRRLLPLGRRIYRELGFRLVSVLTLALLPLGLIAVVQNYRVVAEAQHSADTALLGLTSESVAGERALIQSAMGSAEALGPVALGHLEDVEECRAVFEEFVGRSGLFRFAGLIEPDGLMRCASQGDVRDFSQSESYQELRADPRPVIVSNLGSEITGRSSLIIAQPIWSDERFDGLVLVSMPQYVLNLVREFSQDHAPTGTVVFSDDGRVVGTNPADLDLNTALPQGTSLADLATAGKDVLRGPRGNGAATTFTIVPLISEHLFVLGIWRDEDLPNEQGMVTPFMLGFPFLMWIASLAVAYSAVHWMVIRHIRRLGRQMRGFALGARDGDIEVIANAPAEIRVLSETFSRLARILARDEGDLAASLKEKTVLLREIHHRVKNNLQLIASIISIQGRSVREPEARQVLSNLHERVMALATIHRALYQSDRLSQVRADRLLDEIVSQLASIGAPANRSLEISTQFDDVTLGPDTVVPLSLLATEALTNALKYVGQLDDGRSRISVHFRRIEPDLVEFGVINSCATPRAGQAADSDGTNLGKQLIRAFSQQLEAEIEQGEIDEPDGRFYRLVLRFHASEDPGDPAAGS